MGKINELAMQLAELRKCGEVLIGLSDTLTQLFSADNKSTEHAPIEEKVAPKTEQISLEKVRAILAEKSRAGHTAEVKSLLNEYGVNKLSEMDSSLYRELLDKAEEIQ